MIVRIQVFTSSISLNLGLEPPNMNAAQKATSYARCIRNPPKIRLAVLRCWGMQISVDDTAWTVLKTCYEARESRREKTALSLLGAIGRGIVRGTKLDFIMGRLLHIKKSSMRYVSAPKAPQLYSCTARSHGHFIATAIARARVAANFDTELLK